MGNVADLIFAPARAANGVPLQILTDRLEAAKTAEAHARREHGAVCLAREAGDTRAEPESTGARLAAAEAARRNLEAAVDAAQIAARQTEAERLAEDAALRWPRAEALLAQRVEVCAALQQHIERVAECLAEARRIGAEIWETLPARPQQLPASWALPQAIQVALYAATDGALAAPGIIDSPYVVRSERPDLTAQARAHCEFFASLRA